MSVSITVPLVVNIRRKRLSTHIEEVGGQTLLPSEQLEPGVADGQVLTNEKRIRIVIDQ